MTLPCVILGTGGWIGWMETDVAGVVSVGVALGIGYSSSWNR